MKRFFLLLSVVLLPVLALAQEWKTVNDEGTALGARVSLGVDKKLAKGLHLSVAGELRTQDNFAGIGRWQADVGISYKIGPYVKVGAGYMFIDKLNASSEWIPRHRFYGDVTGALRLGDWRLSLKERLQLTHRNAEGLNVYQTNPNSLALKSRLKAEYRGFSAVSPYVSVEARTVFNDPACTANWNPTTQSFSDYVFTGYTDTYFNRFRGMVGMEWKLSRQHAVDFGVLGDYYYDKEVDTNGAGTKLKSITYDRGIRLHASLGYTFSF